MAQARGADFSPRGLSAALPFSTFSGGTPADFTSGYHSNASGNRRKGRAISTQDRMNQ